ARPDCAQGERGHRQLPAWRRGLGRGRGPAAAEHHRRGRARDRRRLVRDWQHPAVDPAGGQIRRSRLRAGDMTRAIVLIALGFLDACGQADPEPNLIPYERYVIAKIDNPSSYERARAEYAALLKNYRGAS